MHPLTPPTVPARYDGPDAPRCPACGCYPDLHRATCLTCLTGARAALAASRRPPTTQRPAAPRNTP